MTQNHHSESTLERRFRAGDESALAEMYKRFSGPMFAAAYSLLGDRDAAADAVQQAFVQAWRAAERFDDTRDLQPWLYAITRRTAVDVYRLRRRSSFDVPLDETAAGGREPAAEGPSLDATWQVWQVRSALEQLPADERQVLRLAYFQGMTQSEIAVSLGIALGTVKSRTSRAQRRLAGLLSHLKDDDPTQ
jgi:RNA polymerase sigma-70 factor (ECF subfamily)